MQTTPTKNTDLFPETLLIDVVDGHTFTSSLKIAEHFGKQHRDVLKAIRNIIARCSDTERLRNFAQSFTFFISANGAKRKRPIYHLSRDGFIFVVGGFTGDEADPGNGNFSTPSTTWKPSSTPKPNSKPPPCTKSRLIGGLLARLPKQAYHAVKPAC